MLYRIVEQYEKSETILHINDKVSYIIPNKYH